ncbi:YjaG family protein [Thalassotalea ponticola]|uniref:YjaG family protein n=1 Tax=Thalassotalea ponticola TaxID=1523392 RepID=UPI0025B5B397|nr:YjaG family protein [Thalassotalea ponticola]MDN3652461.1 YjaG family protein [Thalassotalea ponticola]
MAKYISLKSLSLWQQTAFACALLERMLPNYQMFSEATEFGDFNVLRNQLNLVWQRLEQGKIKINYDAQLEKLEEVIPDVDNFDFFGVYPALDTCMALGSLLQGIQESDAATIGNVAQLSKGSVSYYLQIMLASEHQDDEQIVIKQSDIDDHPLMQWERDTQQELIQLLASSKENQQTCQSLKQLATEQRLTNLAIEY